jgi:hypothetical protein
MYRDFKKLSDIDKAVKKAEKAIVSGHCNWANELYDLIENINKVINPVEEIKEVTNASH